MNLSQNFSLAETVRSPTAKSMGITLAHTPKTLAATKALVVGLLQPLRARCGTLWNTSWLRTPELQLAIYAGELENYTQAVEAAAGKLSRARSDTGKANARDALEEAQAALAAKEKRILRTQHVKGEAVDIFSNRVSRSEICRSLGQLLDADAIDFDQAIVYNYGGKRRIVHLSYTTRRPNRRQCLVSDSPGSYTRVLSPAQLG